LKISFIEKRRNCALKTIECTIRTGQVIATFTYNDANQVSEVRYSGNSSLVEKYWYDANGKRIKKQNADGEFTYYVNKFYEVDDGTATSYFFRDDERIAKQTAGSMDTLLTSTLRPLQSYH
jgi:uncharacterized protein RhaS with RHS repeats